MQPHRLAAACKQAGINIHQPGEYRVDIRLVGAVHEPDEDAVCTLRFCKCSVQVVQTLVPPSRRIITRLRGFFEAYLFWPDVYAPLGFPGRALLDDQSALQQRIHRDVTGECRDFHEVSIMSARLIVSWFGRYTVVFDNKTWIFRPDGMLRTPFTGNVSTEIPRPVEEDVVAVG